MDGHGATPRVKNGPATTGHGAEAVRDSIAATITTLPAQLRKTLTWDQGAEMAQHAQLRIDTGLAIYFCDPAAPGNAEPTRTDCLLRQYFPKGTDLTKHSASDLQAVAMALNTRPRKTLDWRTPAEALMTIYCCSNQAVLRRPLEPEQYTSTKLASLHMRPIAGPRRVLLRPCASRILFAALKDKRVHPIVYPTRNRAK